MPYMFYQSIQVWWYRTTLNEADLTQATGYLQVFTDTVQEGLPSFCVRHDMFLESHKSHQSHISIYIRCNFISLVVFANLRTFFLRFLELSCMASWFSCLSVLDLLQVGLSAREVLAGEDSARTTRNVRSSSEASGNKRCWRTREVYDKVYVQTIKRFYLFILYILKKHLMSYCRIPYLSVRW